MIGQSWRTPETVKRPRHSISKRRNFATEPRVAGYSLRTPNAPMSGRSLLFSGHECALMPLVIPPPPPPAYEGRPLALELVPAMR